VPRQSLLAGIIPADDGMPPTLAGADRFEAGRGSAEGEVGEID
jgi:hypothetical protein